MIDDTVQKICQEIRGLNFTAVSDGQKKECKKRNLIKEELVFTRHYLKYAIYYLVIVFFITYTVIA